MSGIYYMLLASLLFAFMGVFAKELSSSMSSVEVVFFRNIFGVILITIAILKSPLNQIGGKFYLLLFRGFIGFIALLMFFYNIANIPLAEAMTFSKTSPIFTAIFAYLLLRERLSSLAYIGIFIGFIGIVFITGANPANLEKSDYLGVLSGVLAALAYTSIRELKNYYDTKAIVLSFMLTGTLGPLLLMGVSEFYYIESLDFMLGEFVIPSKDDWIYIVLLGLFSTFAQIFMTKAYSLDKAGVVGAIGYFNILFAVLLGMLILGESFPNFETLFGILLIVISGIFVAKR